MLLLLLFPPQEVGKITVGKMTMEGQPQEVGKMTVGKMTVEGQPEEVGKMTVGKMSMDQAQEVGASRLRGFNRMCVDFV